MPTRPSREESWPLVRRLLRVYLRPHWRRVALSLVGMAVAGLSTAAMARLLQPLVDQVLEQRDEAMLYLVSGAILAVFVLRGGATYIQAVLLADVGRRIIARLQSEMFANLMRADLAAIQAEGSGRLSARFVYDVRQLQATVTNGLTAIGLQGVTLVAMIALMFQMDPALAAIVFIGFPTAMVPIILIGRRIRRISRQTQLQMGQMTAQLGQVFQGIRHVKAYTAEPREAEAAQRLIWRLAELQWRNARLQAGMNPLMEAVAGLAIAAVMIYGGSQVMGEQRTPGTFVAFIGAVLLAYQPARRLATLNAVLQTGLAAADRVFATIDAEPTIRDAADATPVDRVAGHVRLEAVTFAYQPGAPALTAVDLEIPAGRTVALVGPSGAGKSTILNLIPRFYDVGAGRITVDGRDIRTITLQSLRRQIALVSQEVSLFDAAIRDNIAYGRPDATEAEIVDAAKAAAAHDFIAALPHGYDTVVGELGVRLSGGQRQRVAIARAILKDAPILLLDEATSALDTDSEKLVQDALDRLRADRTTLVIAHRLSTVADADRIYVMDQGQVVESGAHGTLLGQDSLYRRLWALQTRGGVGGADAVVASPVDGTAGPIGR